MDGSMNSVQVRTDEQLTELEQLLQSRRLPARMEGVHQLLSAVDAQLDLLQHALAPVLRPQPVAGGQDAPAREAPETELAEFLQYVSLRLAKTHDAAAELIARVDL